MGILRNKDTQYEPIRIEDLQDEALVNEYANYLFDSDFESEPEHEDDKDVSMSTQKNDITRRKKLKRYRRNYVVPEIVDGLQVRRNMGAQKWRRVENAKMIMGFVDIQDICFDGSDLVEETITAFTRLLRDEAKMKIWNEFIEMNEADQIKMIGKIEEEIADEKSKANKAGPSKKVAAADKQTELRKHHPAYSAEICFQRLDKKLRDCLLKRRYIQYDYIGRIEKHMRTFFNDFSSGVYFEDIACRIKRFYVHSVAQFLQLKSQTIDGPESKKLVQVENEKPLFQPPNIFLVTFLKMKRRTRANTRNGSDIWDDDENADF